MCVLFELLSFIFGPWRVVVSSRRHIGSEVGVSCTVYVEVEVPTGRKTDRHSEVS